MNEQIKRRGGTRRVWAVALVLVLLGIILGLVLWTRGNSGATGTANTSNPTTAPGAMTRTNEGSQITIQVTWQGKQAGPIFTVEMDTHAVDLDGYDLRQLAVLRTNQGQEVKPRVWNAPAGGHHRTGTLSFPATLADGTPVIGSDTRTIELVIRNVGDVAERNFTWTL